MEKKWKAALAGCILAGVMAFPCGAEIVTGEAYIENGNIRKAAADARKDAMRSFVEEKVGVHIKSTTVVENFLLVRDSILAKSEGYVLVKKVVSESQDGDIYRVRLDLEANEDRIATEAKDLPARLSAIEDDASRSGINVAIVDEDARQTDRWNRYFTGMLTDTGFRAEVNDDVVDYLGKNLRGVNDLTLSAEVRRIGRTGNRMGANAIIRGRVSLPRAAERVTTKKENVWRAVAEVSCELIGYDTNDVDVSAGYYSAVGASAEEAERLAKEAGLRAAAEELGKEAILTNQREYRGGVHNVRAMVVFKPITQKAMQRDTILAGLSRAGCRVVRSAFTKDGGFSAYVEATDFNNLEELKMEIQKEMAADFPNIAEAVDEGQRGSTKLVFEI